LASEHFDDVITAITFKLCQRKVNTLKNLKHIKYLTWITF